MSNTMTAAPHSDVRQHGLRVLHLSSYDAHDGAARGSTLLAKALQSQGVEAPLVVGRKLSGDPAIFPMPGKIAPFSARLRMKFDRVPLRLYHKSQDAFWTVGWLPSRVGRLTREFAPDIVHLHWVGAGFLSIAALKQFDCPIVWTLRDMWPFTGGCHYTAGCQRYLQMCGACPQLRSQKVEDLSRTIWNMKQKHWQGLDLWFVAISNWLADCTRSSPLLSSFPIEVIPNGIDLHYFRPTAKSVARQAWDLPPDRRIIVYGAMRALQDPRKGYAELIAAIRKLKEAGQAEDLMLVVFGDPNVGELPDLEIASRNVGYISDDHQLSRLYSAADVAVVPSLEEAFGKTVVEAMACGSPVVAFDIGGPRDIITHLHDGYLAEPQSVDDLARGISWALGQVKHGPALGERARAKVEAEYDIDVVAASYEKLYRRILLRTHNGPAPAN